MSTELSRIHSDLGITDSLLSSYKLEMHEQVKLESLAVISIDLIGRPFILASDAGEAWNRMSRSAARDGITLEPRSGFRSYLYQKVLIENKIKKGMAIDSIIGETAIPGFSEHHTGRAVDICTSDNLELTEEFEKSDEFFWLIDRASKFDFYLSYPRDNDQGVIYEPWHWCYHPSRGGTVD